ncbi:MAG TPA: hypothetical protein VHD56_05155 [Tepidisphaeraceae bacterium]|nr:hypothetical protein [Tepidisphaeraceae bacterium]
MAKIISKPSVDTRNRTGRGIPNSCGLQLDWKQSSGWGVSDPAQASDGSVYMVSNRGSVIRVDPQTGAADTIFHAPNADQAYPVKIDDQGLLYFICSSNNKTTYTLYALNSSGNLQWARQIPNGGAANRGIPAIDVTHNLVYVPYYDPANHQSHLPAWCKQLCYSSLYHWAIWLW